MAGKGDFPLRSSWLAPRLLYKTVAVRDATGAQPVVWGDWFFEAAAGGVSNISGATTLTFAPSGALQGLVPASGSATVTFTASATGITVGALSGASAAAFTTAGTIAGAGSLSGAVTTAFTAAGALGGAAPLSGASSLTFTTNGAVTGSGALSGSIPVTFSASAAADVPTSAISGSASISFTASGALTGVSSSLHGRPVRGRGKIVRFADEIDQPIAFVTAVERKEALVEYGDLLEQVRELTAQHKAGQRKRQSEAKQAALQAKIDATAARIEQLAQAEQNWINRLREEDELFLLAA